MHLVVYQCLNNAAIKRITERRNNMNHGSVLGVQLFGEYSCRSPMEQREGLCLESTVKKFQFWGRSSAWPDEVVGTS